MKTQTKNEHIKSKESWNGVPATVRQALFEASLNKPFAESIILHIAAVLLIWLIIFSLNFFGITRKLFPRPKQNIQDIEFIIKDTSRHITRHFANTKKTKSRKVNRNISNLKDNNATDKHSQNSIISDFFIPMPDLKSISTGLGNSGKIKNRAAGIETSNSSINDIDKAFSTNRSSSGHSGFNKNATRKIITAYDISPYVNELRRNVRLNWKIPQGNENNKVELFLRIAKDGKLIILNVKKTSEIGNVDNAALNAVKKCVPLTPLPSKYNKGYLDVIFTFGSNSVGIKY